MIYNFYTYIFISALAASAAFAILLRTLLNRERRTIWDISSVSFLVLLIISLVIFIAGLIVIDSKEISFKGPFVFFMITLIFSTACFYFFRQFYFPAILLTLLLCFLLYSSRLEGFEAFSNSNHFAIKTLQNHDELVSVEIVDFFNDVNFQSLEEGNLFPVFIVIDFPEYFFFLENTSYIKFSDFVNNTEEVARNIESDFLKSKASKLPFAGIRIYEPLPIEQEIYSIYRIETKRNGTFSFYVQN